MDNETNGIDLNVWQCAQKTMIWYGLASPVGVGLAGAAIGALAALPHGAEVLR